MRIARNFFPVITAVLLTGIVSVAAAQSTDAALGRSDNSWSKPESLAKIADSSEADRDSVLSLPAYMREHLQRNRYVYERYRTPEQCANAGARALVRYRRDLRMDTVMFDDSRDTLPKEVSEAVAYCLSRFDFDKLPIYQLAGAARAAILAKDNKRFEFAYQKLLREFPQSDTTRMRQKANRIYAMARFGWMYQDQFVERTNEVAKIVEDMGPGTARYAVEIYQIPFARAESSNEPEIGIDAGKRVEAAWWKMTNEESADWSGFVRGFERWQTFEYWANGTQASRDLVSRHIIPALNKRSGGSPEAREQWKGKFAGYQNLYQYIGDTAPPILSKHWFNSDGAAERLPRSGKVTIVFFLTTDCGGPCYETYGLIRYLNKKFGAGLDIVIVTELKGHFRLHIPKDNAEELELIRDYFLNHLNLPVTLAIDEVRFSRRFDGMRMPEPIVWRRAWPNPSGAILDKSGRFVSFDLLRHQWLRISEVVQKAVDE